MSALILRTPWRQEEPRYWQNELLRHLRQSKVKASSTDTPPAVQAQSPLLSRSSAAEAQSPVLSRSSAAEDDGVSTVLAEVQRTVAPEAAIAWCQAYEVLKLYENEIWKLEQELLQFNSLHIGQDSVATIFALNHFLASNDRLKATRGRWRWRAAMGNPHFEGRETRQMLTEAENSLYCHTHPQWFHSADDSGNLVSGGKWMVENFWEWATRGPSKDPKDVAKRLPHIVLISSWLSSGGTPLALLSLVSALGVLRIGGTLCHSFNLSEEAHFQSIVILCMMLFERVELTTPELHSMGDIVYIVACRFRGVDSVLLKGLVLSVRRILARKQSELISDDCAQSVDQAVITKLRHWLQTRTSRSGLRCLPPDGYLKMFDLRAIAEQSHLLWSCCPDLLRRVGGFYVGDRRSDELRFEGSTQERLAVLAQDLQEVRHSRWKALHEEDSQLGDGSAMASEIVALEGKCCSGDQEQPPRKRMRTDESETAEPACKAQQWFSVDSNNLLHRRLLRDVRIGASAPSVAEKYWWYSSVALPSWRFSHSAFAPEEKLRALIRARHTVKTYHCRHPLEQLWSLQDSCKQVPPALIISLVHIILTILPDRLANSRMLGYRRGLHIGSCVESASWLSQSMGVPTSSVQLPRRTGEIDASASDFVRSCFQGLAVEDPAISGSVDMVIVDLTVRTGIEEWREIAMPELDGDLHKDIVDALLLGLHAVSKSGDLFIRLSSLYTRFLAGIVMLLATAFTRVAVVQSDVVPAWWGERWIVCNVCASTAQQPCSAVRELLGALRQFMWRTPSSSIPNVLPCDIVCTAAGNIREFLYQANSKVIDAELGHWALHASAQRDVQSCRSDASDSSSVLQYLTQMNLKHVLFPGVADRVRVALYFGSFDPMHENHFRMVLCALQSCDIRKVILVPNIDGNRYKPHCSGLQSRIRYIEARISEAEKHGEAKPGQVVVHAADDATNWPQREKMACSVERSELADTTATCEAILLMGEDSFKKSLEEAAGHKNSGIFQLKARPRRIIVFPRGGDSAAILSKVPEFLRSWVEVAPYKDKVAGLSSGVVRDMLKCESAPPSADFLHPVLWQLLQKDARGILTPASAMDVDRFPADAEFAEKHVADEVEFAEKHVVDEVDLVDDPHAHDPRLHYGRQRVQSIQQRCESQTVRVRNFNSFAKAALLVRFLREVAISAASKEGECQPSASTGGAPPPLAVLDVGCGKGGDLQKFANCGVTEYCGVDISPKSLEEFAARVGEFVRKAGGAKHGLLGELGVPLQELTLICADCWRDDLAPCLDRGAAHSIARLDDIGESWFHLVSSQMACHYAFESEESAEMLLHNISQRLCEGGLFVGTLPNASRIVQLQHEAWEKTGQLSTGNGLYEIGFDPSQWTRVTKSLQLWMASFDDAKAEPQDVFGVTYQYSFIDAVDRCYEPLVHFNTLKRLAAKYGLILHMKPTPLAEIVADAHGEGAAKADMGRLRRIYFHKGGMDCSGAAREQEVLQLYIAFAFRKVVHSAACQALGREARPAPVSCAKLSEFLQRLHSSEQGAQRIARHRDDIVHLKSAEQ